MVPHATIFKAENLSANNPLQPNHFCFQAYIAHPCLTSVSVLNKHSSLDLANEIVLLRRFICENRLQRLVVSSPKQCLGTAFKLFIFSKEIFLEQWKVSSRLTMIS